MMFIQVSLKSITWLRSEHARHIVMVTPCLSFLKEEGK